MDKAYGVFAYKFDWAKGALLEPAFNFLHAIPRGIKENTIKITDKHVVVADHADVIHVLDLNDLEEQQIAIGGVLLGFDSLGDLIVTMSTDSFENDRIVFKLWQVNTNTIAQILSPISQFEMAGSCERFCLCSESLSSDAVIVAAAIKTAGSPRVVMINLAKNELGAF